MSQKVLFLIVVSQLLDMVEGLWQPENECTALKVLSEVNIKDRKCDNHTE